ncbi:MAG TPA: hypothetical protein VHA12_00245 [Candidatus Nanoarchaeia archaeon]|nr:hypothetical protein [Candidatus Nanoarchaeia archaeon]
MKTRKVSDFGLAIKFSISLGRSLQQTNPEIADRFQNESARDIARTLLSSELSYNGSGKVTSLNVLEHAVRYHLRGNDSSLRGEVYEGSLDPEEYRKLTKKHKEDYGRNRGIDCKIKKTGIYGLKHDDLVGNAIKGAISRGELPWSDRERLVALGYMVNNSISETANYINEIFHEGNTVRTKDAVHEMKRRFKRQLSRK